MLQVADTETVLTLKTEWQNNTTKQSETLEHVVMANEVCIFC